MVPLRGIEPRSQAPEACILSIKLQGQSLEVALLYAIFYTSRKKSGEENKNTAYAVFLLLVWGQVSKLASLVKNFLPELARFCF